MVGLRKTKKSTVKGYAQQGGVFGELLPHSFILETCFVYKSPLSVQKIKITEEKKINSPLKSNSSAGGKKSENFSNFTELSLTARSKRIYSTVRIKMSEMTVLMEK